jgi:sugar/nucleoside kinase (ribokinase family)
MNVVSVGDLVLDIILPVKLPVNVHQDVPARRVEPGGAGNFMIAARHMGLDVSAVGAVGADLFGAQILDILRQESVDTTGVVAVPGSTTTLVIALTDQQSGEHVFIGHYGEGAEAPYPSHADALIASADALFLQGYTLAEKRVVPMALRAVERAAAARVPIYLDVGPFMAQVTPERIRWIVECADILLMTEEEVPLVSEGMSGEAAFEQLLAAGPQVLVVKRGASGCLLATPDMRDDVPGFAAKVVDTVGAGDCFDAAFVAGSLRGLNLHDCALLANAMGAASVQKMGAGRNAPTCAEVNGVLSQAGVGLDFPC